MLFRDRISVKMQGVEKLHTLYGENIKSTC